VLSCTLSYLSLLLSIDLEVHSPVNVLYVQYIACSNNLQSSISGTNVIEYRIYYTQEAVVLILTEQLLSLDFIFFIR